MLLYHNSHDLIYRSPFGACPAGASVTLRLKVDPPADLVVARLWHDGKETLCPMDKRGPLYEAVCTMPDEPCLMWYYFYAEKDGKRTYLGNAPDHMGGEGSITAEEPASYQITVFDPSFKTPSWMRHSLFYQILPDRFRSSRPMAHRVKPPRGHLHKTWNEPPESYVGKETEPNAANDFFGGDLNGIRRKLPYIRRLGINALYLNPIFEAASNHKYDTGDYRKIDPSFGTEEDFIALCEEAKAMGIRIVLDGVFSHTGADSRYFNRYGNYDSVGAWQSRESPYASWYRFRSFPDDYECWWDFKSLPDVDEANPDYRRFIINGDDSVTTHWVRDGASGWRLDVADELPTDFMRELRSVLKEREPDAAIIGEVWEDASNKCAYNEMRTYCAGDMLDSVMNYPLREAIVSFMLEEISAESAMRRIVKLRENYPKTFFYSLLNLLGSHDRARIISVLAGEKNLDPEPAGRRYYTLSDSAYETGRERFLAAWRFICAMPGMPCLYYGDEAGLTGMGDPFCRCTYPWGREDKELVDSIRRINHERRQSDVLQTGDFRLYAPREDVLVVARRIIGGVDVFGDKARNGLILTCVNRSGHPAMIRLPADDWLNVPLEVTVPARAALRVDPEDAPRLPFDPSQAHWVSRPQHTRVAGEDVIITTEPGLDPWQHTWYGLYSDDTPGLLLDTEEQYFTFSFELSFPAENPGDQAGMVLYQDPDNWFRVSAERGKGAAVELTSAVTDRSHFDWAALGELPHAPVRMKVRVSRKGNRYRIEISRGNASYRVMRVFRLAEGCHKVRFGVFAASPGEKPFVARFQNMGVGPCVWERK
ncbi:MAG: DUF1349 domain-containing protein [Clostridia bacterium]|nr:DUF1349 domain-containing protein [Clostridia bacterium]